jgi:hypothetical protein
MRILVAIVLGLVLSASGRAFAEPTATQPPAEQARAVALLPLDAGAKLELFGHSVASEVSRALVQGGLDVVVVSPYMAVPAKARMIVDGTIKPGKGGAVELAARLRDVKTGDVLVTIPVEAASVNAMDRAAEELSAKVLPVVKTELAKLIAKDQQDQQALQPKHVDEPKRVEPPASRATALAAIYASPSVTPQTQVLRTALEAALAPWAAHRHHATRVLDIHQLGDAPKKVASERADLAVELDVLSIDLQFTTPVPMASARVRLRIIDPQAVVFDRVIVTDTVVGEKGLDADKLTERVAREVLEIADPHLKRRISTWY